MMKNVPLKVIDIGTFWENKKSEKGWKLFWNVIFGSSLMICGVILIGKLGIINAIAGGFDASEDKSIDEKENAN